MPSLRPVVVGVVEGEQRGVLPGVVVGFVVLDTGTNNPVVTEVRPSLAIFP